MQSNTRTPWYRVPTMMIVAGVLGFTVISGMSMLTIASSQNDALVISDQDYRQWRDDMRATAPLPADDANE
jgi:hypothetical protein